MKRTFTSFVLACALAVAAAFALNPNMAQAELVYGSLFESERATRGWDNYSVSWTLGDGLYCAENSIDDEIDSTLWRDLPRLDVDDFTIGVRGATYGYFHHPDDWYDTGEAFPPQLNVGLAVGDWAYDDIEFALQAWDNGLIACTFKIGGYFCGDSFEGSLEDFHRLQLVYRTHGDGIATYTGYVDGQVRVVYEGDEMPTDQGEPTMYFGSIWTDEVCIDWAYAQSDSRE